ncbi:hypothetical protein HPB50_026930 [Hyalomma asiaticum]|uniref:Uncharacterized protein n=1 Tax=Hyalomma asiaticum TaxID=266040 RepID=A0ACB7TC66_HYAAI|nr:hypothetical protein HPB50_026930 [Hyalomma asiaticum]
MVRVMDVLASEQSSGENELEQSQIQPMGARPRPKHRKSRNCPDQLPLYPCVLAPKNDAGDGGPGIDSVEEQLRAAQVPPKRFGFNHIDDYQHPTNLKPWAATLQRPPPQEPDTDSEDDTVAHLRKRRMLWHMSSYSIRAHKDILHLYPAFADGELPGPMAEDL